MKCLHTDIKRPVWSVSVFQNDTIRLLFSYHDLEPPGLYIDGSLPYHGPKHRGTRVLYLTERLNVEESPLEDTVTWDLRNPAVSTTSIAGLVLRLTHPLSNTKEGGSPTPPPFGRNVNYLHYRLVV